MEKCKNCGTTKVRTSVPFEECKGEVFAEYGLLTTSVEAKHPEGVMLNRYTDFKPIHSTILSIVFCPKCLRL